jgi:hypothetical protein
MREPPRICSLCWIDRKMSVAIDGWEGIPLCRKHMAETLVRVGDLPVITPSPGIEAPLTLQ